MQTTYVKPLAIRYDLEDDLGRIQRKAEVCARVALRPLPLLATKQILVLVDTLLRVFLRLAVRLFARTT